MRNLLVAGVTVAFLLPKLLLAQEAVVTLRATVTGNQEQPKVMYILPWQQPLATDFEYVPGAGVAQDLFTEVDRDEFVRELNYREILTQLPVSAEK
jgi:hypothetical protein